MSGRAKWTPGLEETQLYVGAPRSGKSTACKQHARAWPRLVAWDPQDEWSRRGRKRATVRLGPAAHRLTLDDLLARPEKLLERDCSIAVVPPTKRADCAAALVDLVELLQEAAHEPSWPGIRLVLDEVHWWGGLRVGADALETLVCMLPKEAISTTVIAQRPVMVPPTARAAIQRWFAFSLPDGNDQELLAERCGQAFATRVKELPRHGFAVWEMYRQGQDHQEQARRSK